MLIKILKLIFNFTLAKFPLPICFIYLKLSLKEQRFNLVFIIFLIVNKSKLFGLENSTKFLL